MLTDWLASLSITMTGVVTFAIMLAAAAAGRSVRLAQVRRSGPGVQESGESVAQEGYLLGATLGLLGLLLAFTFGMVLSRYEARRALATQEANAIGTSYLRAQLLDEPHRSRLSGLLIAYTENRIRLAGDADEARFLAVNDRLLTEIWSAVAAARESALAHGLSTAVLMTYNEVIDLDTERKLAWNLRTPAEVLLLLLLYLAVTAAVVGHSVDGPRGRRSALVLFTLIALSITVMADLNRPMSGRARESQQAMRMLLASLKAQPPAAFDKFRAPQSAAGANDAR